MNTPILDAYVKATPYGGFQSFGHDMNESLRSSITPTNEQKQTIDDFDAEFTNLSQTHMELYRATSMDTLTPFIKANILSYPAFISTSRSIGASIIFLNRVDANKEKVLLKIAYPKNHPYIDTVGVNNEQEVVLPRNCKFKISEWTPTEDEKIRIGFCTCKIMELKLAEPPLSPFE